MNNQDDEQTPKQPASTDPVSAGSDPTGPIPPVVPPPTIRDDRPPGPSVRRPADGGLAPVADWPHGPSLPASPSPQPAAHRRRKWRIGLMAAAAFAALAAGTTLGHVIWSASAPTTSPAGSSSATGSPSGSSGSAKSQSPTGSGSTTIPTKRYPGASGGSNGGSSQPPSGSGGSLNPSGQYPSGSGGSSSGGSSQSPTGSGSTTIPTKRYPGASGGSNGGSSQPPSGSGGSPNPSSQYRDGASS
jgi:hypothetical protein